MSVLLSFDVAERRALASSGLQQLTQALRREIEPLIAGALPIPEQKARLTRIGGRCALDGSLLEFDPWSPHEHRCRQCQRVYIDRAHDDWWAMGAQLWTAERAAQAAALSVATGDNNARTVALRILDAYADRYGTWLNSDNALGPTRPFFSTYLESIWLINLCHAIALLEAGGADSATLSRVKDRVIAPSRSLIAEFHEGRSNRQVWNEVAVLSASCILGDAKGFETRVHHPQGLFSQFSEGLLQDGSWYEGENYHLFAHRGLWYGVQLLQAQGIDLPAEPEARFRAGFIAPFLGVLPDNTIPSRRDSQYRVSLRQWRFAEWCELGIAHAASVNQRPDARLSGMLQRLYNSSSAEQFTDQNRHQFSTADAERNEPGGLLSRASLSWRALLMATPDIPVARGWSPGSVCLSNQGLAVIRRESGQVYVALEGGHTGGGHGHPDRLSLTVQRGASRWHEDPGTGSYVERKLHWYRSTLAHAAPVIDGASQDAVPAQLIAFEDRGGAGWIVKRVENVKPGVNLTRTVVVCDGYFIDLLEWDADRDVRVELPLPRGAEFGAQTWMARDPEGAGGLEDGFDFLDAVQVACTNSLPHRFERLSARIDPSDSTTAGPELSCASSTPMELWRADAPGSPGEPNRLMHWVRARASHGCIATLWNWARGVQSHAITVDDNAFLSASITVDGTTSVHTRTDEGWHIAFEARGATSSIDLTRLSSTVVEKAAPSTFAGSVDETTVADITPTVVHIPDSAPVSFALGELHYLRTEQPWHEADRPSATIAVAAANGVLEVRVIAETGPIVVPGPTDENALDNERRDVNADGVELFVGSAPGGPWSASWIAVPASDDPTGAAASLARVTATSANAPPLSSSWTPRVGDRGGYEMRLQLQLTAIPINADGTFVMEVIVNERPAHRARRRGQLVLSGGGGWAYLRGDRSDSARALSFRVSPAALSAP
jgi:hypothetical protein